MVVLRYEAWRFSDHLAFQLAGREADAFNIRVSGPGELSYVVHTTTYEAAMQVHYDRQGWGTYQPMLERADAHTASQLARQLAEYPEDADLRRLNGVSA